MLLLKQKFERLSKKQLRRMMWLFFLALFIPSGLLIYKAISQLKWETFHQHRQLAEEFSHRFDVSLSRLIAIEEKRSFTDYSFLNVAGDSSSNLLLRSPLSNFPVKSQIPGLLGYFQISTEGDFSTTLLPVDSVASIYGISETEFQQRKSLQDKLFRILSENKLVKKQSLKTVAAGEIVSSAPSRKNQDVLGSESIYDANEGESSVEKLSDALSENASLDQTKMDSDFGYNKSGSLGLTDEIPVEEIILDAELSNVEFSNKERRDRLVPQSRSKAKAKALSKSSTPETQLAFDDLKKYKRSKKGKISKNLLQEQKNEALQDASIEIKDEAFAKIIGNREDNQRLKSTSDDELSETDSLAIAGRKLRTESNLLPEQTFRQVQAISPVDYRVQIFQSEIDFFELSLLDSGHFVLFRKVWKNGNRYIQGALIEPKVFFDALVGQDFKETSLSQVSHLAATYEQQRVSFYPSRQSARSSRINSYLDSENELQGELLYQSRFSAPFSELEFVFTVENLAAGSGDKLVIWISLLIVLVLCMGFYLMYQLGSRQIDLLSQQQNFVSSVSHELKTPLTSIRMYGEMLLQGWVTDSKKQEYYRYIHDESERLSRLINNVLQLSKMSRDNLQINLRSHSVSELIDHIRSKISSQLESAGFKLNLVCDSEIQEKVLQLDLDAFTQVIINLVDNAIKFSSAENNHQIELACRMKGSHRIQFSVRDFGKGIAKQQMKKIFKLFYRVENELTRETIGTGIGLALVQKLVTAMQGEVDVVNCDPGAEFRISFQAQKIL